MQTELESKQKIVEVVITKCIQRWCMSNTQPSGRLGGTIKTVVGIVSSETLNYNFTGMVGTKNMYS